MKTLLTVILLFGACGLKPMTQPYGCRGDWICVCNSDRDCDWVLVCR